MKKNIGIILMLLGVLLTINQDQYNSQVYQVIQDMIMAYWPLLLSFIGIYLVSSPVKKK